MTNSPKSKYLLMLPDGRYEYGRTEICAEDRRKDRRVPEGIAPDYDAALAITGMTRREPRKPPARCYSVEEMTAMRQSS